MYRSCIEGTRSSAKLLKVCKGGVGTTRPSVFYSCVPAVPTWWPDRLMYVKLEIKSTRNFNSKKRVRFLECGPGTDAFYRLRC